jgi:hypothetical protein
VRRNLGLLVLSSCVVWGCKKPDPPPSDEPPSAEISRPDRRTQCEQLAHDAASGAAVGFKLAALALFDDPPGKRDADALDGLLAGAHRELLEQCLTWPEETFRCLSSPIATFDEECRRRVAELSGTATAPSHVPAGPGVAWRTGSSGRVRDLHVANDGRVIVLHEPSRGDEGSGDAELLALEAGEPVWRATLARDTRLRHTDDAVLAWRGDELKVLDPASGEIRWQAALPDDEHGFVSRPIEMVARSTSGWIVADSDGRFFEMSASDCAAKRPACARPMGRLEDEVLVNADLLVLDDQIWIREYESLRAFALSDLGPRFAVRPDDRVGWTVAHPDGLATVLDGDVTLLDPESCLGPGADRPPTSKPATRGGDACLECTQLPAGCVRWRRTVQNLDVAASPAVLSDGTVVVHDDRGFTLGIRGGEVAWSTATGGIGPILPVGDELLVLSIGFAEGDRLTIRGLGEDGEHRFESPLPFSVDDPWVSADDFLFAAGQELVAVFHRGELLVVDLSQRD